VEQHRARSGAAESASNAVDASQGADATLADAKILIEENDLLGLDDSLVECDVADFEPLVAAGTEESLAKRRSFTAAIFSTAFSSTKNASISG